MELSQFCTPALQGLLGVNPFVEESPNNLGSSENMSKMWFLDGFEFENQCDFSLQRADVIFGFVWTPQAERQWVRDRQRHVLPISSACLCCFALSTGKGWFEASEFDFGCPSCVHNPVQGISLRNPGMCIHPGVMYGCEPCERQLFQYQIALNVFAGTELSWRVEIASSSSVLLCSGCFQELSLLISKL